MKALPVIILGVGLTAGAALIIGGCAVAKNAWALLIIIPAFFGLIAVSMLRGRDDFDMFSQEPIFSTDGLVFILFSCLVSLFALPAVLYHVEKIKSTTALVLDIVGIVVIILGGLGIQFCKPSDDFRQL